MPPMPEGSAEGILRGIYKFKPAADGEAVAQLFGSGPILNEVLRAQEILASKYGVQTDVWSVTELYGAAARCAGGRAVEPTASGGEGAVPYVLSALGSAQGPIIAASDYMKSVPDMLSPWLRTGW